jgi:hypothetical protein
MEITRAELRNLYESMTVDKLRERLGGIGPTQLYRLLDEAGIQRRGRKSHKIKLVDPPPAPELAARFLADIMSENK